MSDIAQRSPESFSKARQSGDKDGASDFIAVDWGTSNFRAYLVGHDGKILQQSTAPDGLLSITDGGFEACLVKHCGDWLAGDIKPPVIMAGMIGAKTGWVDAPYGNCPANAKDLAGLVVPIANDLGADIRIVPGLMCRDEQGAPDIMRGEETMLMGLLARQPGYEGLALLPGTHSKHARLAGGRVQGFRTVMSGEIFELLSRQSILRLTVALGQDDAIASQPAFADGVSHGAREPENLLHNLFSVRSRGVVDGRGDIENGAYLSGLLLGTELASVAEQTEAAVSILAAPELAALYHTALAILQKPSDILDPKAALLAGLQAIIGPSG